MKRNKFKLVVGAGLISLALAGCGNTDESAASNVDANDSLDTIIEKAKQKARLLV